MTNMEEFKKEKNKNEIDLLVKLEQNVLLIDSAVILWKLVIITKRLYVSRTIYIVK